MSEYYIEENTDTKFMTLVPIAYKITLEGKVNLDYKQTTNVYPKDKWTLADASYTDYTVNRAGRNVAAADFGVLKAPKPEKGADKSGEKAGDKGGGKGAGGGKGSGGGGGKGGKGRDENAPIPARRAAQEKGVGPRSGSPENSQTVFRSPFFRGVQGEVFALARAQNVDEQTMSGGRGIEANGIAFELEQSPEGKQLLQLLKAHENDQIKTLSEIPGITKDQMALYNSIMDTVLPPGVIARLGGPGKTNWSKYPNGR
jgi:hypothetical protein